MTEATAKACMVAQTVNNWPAMQETWVQSLRQEDPLEKGMATHSSSLAWRIPWTEEPGGLQFMGSQRARHDWATKRAHKGARLSLSPPVCIYPRYTFFLLKQHLFCYFQLFVEIQKNQDLATGPLGLVTKILHSHCLHLASISGQRTEILFQAIASPGHPRSTWTLI